MGILRCLCSEHRYPYPNMPNWLEDCKEAYPDGHGKPWFPAGMDACVRCEACISKLQQDQVSFGNTHCTGWQQTSHLSSVRIPSEKIEILALGSTLRESG
eukprot:gene26167-biopygen14562